MMAAGTEVVVARAETASGNLPVGIITLAGNDEMAWPHVFWFPMASPRNKLEVSAKFLAEIKQTHVALIIAAPADIPWFMHLGKYGLIRRIGTLRHVGGRLEGKALFQTVNS